MAKIWIHFFHFFDFSEKSIFWTPKNLPLVNFSDPLNMHKNGVQKFYQWQKLRTPKIENLKFWTLRFLKSDQMSIFHYKEALFWIKKWTSIFGPKISESGLNPLFPQREAILGVFGKMVCTSV